MQASAVRQALLSSLSTHSTECHHFLDAHSRLLFESLLKGLTTHQDVSSLDKPSKTLQECTEERLKSVPYKQVTLALNSCFFIACILRACWFLSKEGHYKEAIKELDMGLIIAGNPMPELPVHDSIYALQQALLPPLLPSDSFPQQYSSCPLVSPLSPIRIDVIAFKQHMSTTNTPLYIKDEMEHWPCLELWKQKEYWYRHVGPDRLVAVEIGSHYTDDTWTQEILEFGVFLDAMIEGKEPLMYLAQYDLFDHSPRLLPHVLIPDYCCFTELGDGHVIKNIWMGPKGTVSPLHQDPHNNIFCQIVGHKYIRLYSPDYTNHVYPYQDPMLHNTSQVDIQQPDLTRFPLFPQAPFIECIVGPGDMVYIPKGWWHYVTSLSVSISVSFWF